MLGAALDYAARGWLVFPLKPKSKQPLTAHGLDDATRDSEQIKTWWTSQPAANIGLVTGPGSGFWVVDLDLKGKISGADSLAEIEERCGYLPETVEQVTPSGGRHLLFKWNGCAVKNSASKIGPGIDTRGERGYIVATPSIHPNGKAYEWSHGPGSTALADAPHWLTDLLTAPIQRVEPPPASEPPSTGTAYVDQAMKGEIELVRSAHSGTRNHQLNESAFKLGGFVRTGYLDKQNVEAALYQAAHENGLLQEDGERSVRATIASGLGAGGVIAPREVPAQRYREKPRSRTHSPIIVNGRPADLQPCGWADWPLWDGEAMPERQWIVGDLIPEGNVTMISGDGGIGKSLLALQLLAACALGKPWIGRGCRPCKTMGIFCEDDDTELRIRMGSIVQHYDVSFADLGNMRTLSRPGEDNLLIHHASQWEEGEASPFFTRIQNDVLDFGAEVVVFDSLHDFFGGNENSRPQARQFIGLLRGLAMRIKGAVIITGHPSMSGRSLGTGEAGSTAWNNAIRSRLYLTTPKVDGDETPEPDARILANKKANYSKRGGEIKLTWKEGVFLNDDPEQGIMASIERRSCESVFLAALVDFVARKRPVSDSPRAGNFAPRAFLGLKETKGFSLGDLRRAMEGLFSSRQIEVSSYTAANRTSYRCLVPTGVMM